MPVLRPSLEEVLTCLIAGWEGECVEFKQANDNFPTSDIGKYFSALSNEANLRGLDAAWLVFGVNDKTRQITGTSYREDHARLHSLKHQIASDTDPNTSFREIHELDLPQGRVVLFEIPPAPRGIPIGWKTHHYARDGETLTGLSIAKLDEIRAQTISTDWSAAIVDGATTGDLDSDALSKAREVFSQKHRERISLETIHSWDAATFLEKARLTRNGRITRTCLLLLGREETTTLLNPHVAEMTWKLEGPELAYEHFHPPFLLTSSLLFQRIRNIRLSFLPANQLIPVDVTKYDQRIILEALHNCIAHQDYNRCERILITERLSELVFQNAGAFYEGSPEDYVLRNLTPTRYRNRFLAEAMVQLRMIDTMGFGIRDIMFRGQAARYLPMPDYDETGPERVILRIQGRFLDENYSRALLTHTDLPWPELIALDAVQKGLPPDKKPIASLREKGLIEGRSPQLHIAPHLAEVTGSEAEYIHHRAFDDLYYCDLIVQYLEQFGSAKRAKFNRLLEGKLSDLLTPQQKRKKISNLLTRMKRENKAISDGYGQGAVWKLPDSKQTSHPPTPENGK